MQIEHLRAIVYLYDMKDISLAAQKSGYEYHYMYNICKKLEKELDLKLIEKGNYGKISFTAEGEKVIYKMKKIISDYDDIFSATPSNTLRIGVDTVFPSLLQSLVYLRRKELGNAVNIELITNRRHHDFSDMLRNKEIDMFFGHYVPIEDLNYTEIKRDKLYLGCNMNQFEGKVSVDLTDLQGMNFILSRSIGTVLSSFFNALNDNGISYQFSYDENDNLLSLKAYENPNVSMLVPGEFRYLDNKLIQTLEIKGIDFSYGCYYRDINDKIQKVINLAKLISENEEQ